jgi:hypothetical protein
MNNPPVCGRTRWLRAMAWCIILFAPFVLVGVIVLAPILNRTVEESRRKDANTRRIGEMVAGGETVDQLPLYDAEFLAEICRQPRCAALIEGVVVRTHDVSDPTWARLKDLPNLRAVTIYDCPNAERILECLRGKNTRVLPAGVKNFCQTVREQQVANARTGVGAI